MSVFRDTALIRAVDMNCIETVRELLHAGVLVDKTNAVGDTPLIDAARYGCQTVVKELITNGASVDKKNKDGTTALMSAAKCGCVEAVEALLSSGANISVKNKRGETATVVARQSPYSKTEIVKLLEEAEREKVRQSLSTPSKKCQPERVIREVEVVSDSPVKNSQNECPLITNPSFPDVTFLGEPQVKSLSCNEDHHDFQNGIELTIPPCAIRQDSTCSISVQSSFAPESVFSLPRDVVPASPSFLISGTGDELEKEITLSMEHNVKLTDEQDTQDLLFLQARATPKISNAKTVYEFEEVADLKSEFKSTENKGRLSITRRLSERFLKIGFRKKRKNSQHVATSNGAAASPETTNQSPPVDNLYTLRVFRSPTQTPLDRRVVVITVSLFGKAYSKFWSDQDILHEYPEVSSEPVDWTRIEPLSFTGTYTTLTFEEISGWIVNSDVKRISRRAVDLPQCGKFNPEDLSSYPPRIISTFHSVKYSHDELSKSCAVSMAGFDEDVLINIPLSSSRQYMPEDAHQLQKAMESLKVSALGIQFTDLDLTITSITTLMERIFSSSSLEEVVEHTEMFAKEINALSTLAQSAATNCSNHTIKRDIEACLPTLKSLSHHFCQFAKVKLRHCQGSLESIALTDLADSGAGVLRAMKYLFRNLHALNAITLDNSKAYTILVKYGEMITSAFSQEPKTLAMMLFASNLISECVLQETNQLNEISTDKGRRLYTAILEKTKANPEAYTNLLSILRNHAIYNDLIRTLEVC